MSDTPSADGWARTRALFHELLELPGPARAERLAALRAQDPARADELVALLAAHDRAEREGGFGGAGPSAAASWQADAGAAPDADPPPARVGRYRVLRRLGAGGMGEVLLAEDPDLGRPVALKRLPAARHEDAEARARLLREARAAASLNHPHIATIYEVGSADGRDYIAFEYVQGRTLAERLADGPLPFDELLDVALPLADALAAAHARGVVHRDLKPANVLLDANAGPKLVDFGLAKLDPSGARLDASASGHARTPASAGAAPASTHPPSTGPGSGSTLTRAGAVFGTPGAMSPEQVRGEAVDARSDVFSFGALLHELATGEPPFRGANAVAVLGAVLHVEPEPLARRRPELPPRFTRLVHTALAKDPAARTQDMAAIAAELRALRAGVGARPRPGARLLARLGPRLRRALLATGALLVAALGVAGLLRVLGAPPAVADPAAGVAVMYFENRVDPDDAEHLGAMLTRLVAAELAAGNGARVLSQQRLHDVARELGRPDGRVLRDNASAVARRAGVGAMVLGEIDRLGDALLASAELVEPSSGRALGAVRAEVSDAEQVFALAETLGTQLRELLRAPDMSREERRALGRRLTSSVEAYRAFVRGQQLEQQGDIDAAAEAYADAVALDPGFALAWFRRAMVLTWTGDGVATALAMSRAREHRERLPPEVRLIMDAAEPYFRDHTSAALPSLLDVLEREPFHREALFFVGEIFTHSATANDARRAADAYEHLLELDPDFAPVFDHQLTAWMQLGAFDRARAQLAAWEAAVPDELGVLRARLALWTGELEAAARALDALEVPPREDLLRLAILHPDAPSPVRDALLAAPLPALLDELAAVEGTYRALALGRRAALLALHGRLADAAELQRLAAAVDAAYSPDGYVTSVRHLALHHRAELLERLGERAPLRAELAAALELQPESARLLYLQARWHLRAGEPDAARALLARLERLAGEPGRTPTLPLYADAVAAELALHDGDAARARELLAALADSGRLMEDWYAFGESAGPLLREGLARACLALGDAPGAAAALDALLASGFERVRHPLVYARALATRGLLPVGDPGARRALLERWVALQAPAAERSPEVAARLAEVRAALAR